jgi:hypothetical protein
MYSVLFGMLVNAQPADTVDNQTPVRVVGFN